MNWDGAWEVVTAIDEFGWSVEFAIPFRTIRFPTEDLQSWGINFQRNIRRRNEQSFWAPIPAQYSLTRVALAGEVFYAPLTVRRSPNADVEDDDLLNVRVLLSHRLR